MPVELTKLLSPSPGLAGNKSPLQGWTKEGSSSKVDMLVEEGETNTQRKDGGGVGWGKWFESEDSLV